MIYLDACALVKFVKSERETAALRAWRQALQQPTELITSTLSQVEVTRTLLRAGVDHKLVPHYTNQALLGIYQVDLTSTVLDRAKAYRISRLGTLDAIHLASADPFRTELSEFITYDQELTNAALGLGFPVTAPS